ANDSPLAAAVEEIAEGRGEVLHARASGGAREHPFDPFAVGPPARRLDPGENDLVAHLDAGNVERADFSQYLVNVLDVLAIEWIGADDDVQQQRRTAYLLEGGMKRLDESVRQVRYEADGVRQDDLVAAGQVVSAH